MFGVCSRFTASRRSWTRRSLPRASLPRRGAEDGPRVPRVVCRHRRGRGGGHRALTPCRCCCSASPTTHQGSGVPDCMLGAPVVRSARLGFISSPAFADVDPGFAARGALEFVAGEAHGTRGAAGGWVDHVEAAQRLVQNTAHAVAHAKGQTPPTAWPTSSMACSGVSIFAFAPNCALYFGLSMRPSPAHTMSTGAPSTMNESVLAMRAGSQPTARRQLYRGARGLELAHALVQAELLQVLSHVFDGHGHSLVNSLSGRAVVIVAERACGLRAFRLGARFDLARGSAWRVGLRWRCGRQGGFPGAHGYTVRSYLLPSSSTYHRRPLDRYTYPLCPKASTTWRWAARCSCPLAGGKPSGMVCARGARRAACRT